MVMVMYFIYRTKYSLMAVYMDWIEIERQNVKSPLAAAISPCFDLTHPPNPRKNVKYR